MDTRLNGHDQYTPPRRLLGADGLPITSERYGQDGFPLSHVIQMGAIAQSGWEVYWDRWDEARRHSRENALAMEKDCFLQALLQERALATSTLKWHVHADDEKDPYQKALKDGMQRVLSCTPHKTRLNYQTLKNGMWYGRGASQLVWEWREISVPVVKAMPVTPPGIMPPAQGKDAGAGINTPVRGEEAGEEPQPFLRERHLAAPPQDDPFAGGLPGNPAGTPAAVTVADERRRSLCVKRHQPVHGDSIYHKWDGTPVVLTYAPAQRDVAGSRMTWTTAGSIATVLAGTWRERFIVYSHESKPAEFFDYEKAEAIHGAGLRDVLYWSWWMKSELAEWITTFYERWGLGLRLWGYEAGNKASYDEVFALATASSRRVNVMVPVFGGKSGQQQVGGLTAVETPVAGAEAVRMMLEYYDANMERYVVGQSMSGGADSESGLGGTGRAKFAANTKYQLVKYDAENLADCYTSDWLRVSQRWTYPEARDVPLEFRFNVPDPDNQEKLEGVEKAISFGVDFKKDEVRGLTGMSDPQPGDDIVGGMAQQAAEMAAELMAAEADQPPPGGDRGEVSGALPFRRDGGVERHVTDAAGHEHRPAGEGGGQFTGVGGGHELSKKANRATERAASASRQAGALKSPEAHRAAYQSHRTAADEHFEAAGAIGRLAAGGRASSPVAEAAAKRMQSIASEHEAHYAHHEGKSKEHRAASLPAAPPVRQEGVPAHTPELLNSMRVRGVKTAEEARAMDAKIAAHLAPVRASRSPLHEQIKATLRREGEDRYGKRMKDAYEAASAAHPGLTVPQFHAALIDLKESGDVDFDPGTRDYSEDPENVPFILPYPDEDPRTGFKTRVSRHAMEPEKDRNIASRALRELGRALGLLEKDRGMAQSRHRKVERDGEGNIVGLVDEYPEVGRHVTGGRWVTLEDGQHVWVDDEGRVSPSGPATRPAPKETESGKVETATAKAPYEMTQGEYREAASKLTKPDGYPDYAARKEAGLNDNWQEAIVRAVKEGKPVPQHIIDQSAPAVEAQERRKLAGEFGEGYADRLREIAANVAPLHEVIGRSGDEMTVRQRQLPRGDFHEHKKGEILTTPDGPMIVTAAKKPETIKADGSVRAYAQVIKARPAKPGKEQETAKRAVAANAAVEHAGAPRNQSYPDLKKKQMAEYAALVRQAMGAEDSSEVGRHVTDASGHEHKPAGTPEGGQFVGGGYAPGSGAGVLYQNTKHGSQPPPAEAKAARVAERQAVKAQIGEAGHPEGAGAMAAAAEADPMLAEAGQVALEIQHSQKYSGSADVEASWNPEEGDLTVWESAGKKIHLATGEGGGVVVSGGRGSKLIPEGMPHDEAAYLIHRVAGLRVPKHLSEKYGPKYAKKPRGA